MVLQVASSGLLAGMTAPKLTVRLRETALTSLPPSLLLPVPRSTRLTLDVGNSLLSTLSAPLLNALDSRKNRLTFEGLNSNPINCDCNILAYKRWLLNHPSNVTCHQPDYHQGKSLLSIPETELICGARPTTRPPVTTTTTQATTTTTKEPQIIWSVPPTERARTPEPPVKTVKSAGTNGNTMANDDTLIIGIVGGVVAFILLLIIIICIARCRMSSDRRYRGGPLAAPPMIPLPPACTCVKPPPSSIYMSPYTAKMAQQAMAYPSPGGQPYYISYPPDDQSVHMETMRSHMDTLRSEHHNTLRTERNYQ